MHRTCALRESHSVPLPSSGVIMAQSLDTLETRANTYDDRLSPLYTKSHSRSKTGAHIGRTLHTREKSVSKSISPLRSPGAFHPSGIMFISSSLSSQGPRAGAKRLKCSTAALKLRRNRGDVSRCCLPANSHERLLLARLFGPVFLVLDGPLGSSDGPASCINGPLSTANSRETRERLLDARLYGPVLNDLLGGSDGTSSSINGPLSILNIVAEWHQGSRSARDRQRGTAVLAGRVGR